MFDAFHTIPFQPLQWACPPIVPLTSLHWVELSCQCCYWTRLLWGRGKKQSRKQWYGLILIGMIYRLQNQIKQPIIVQAQLIVIITVVGALNIFHTTDLVIRFQMNEYTNGWLSHSGPPQLHTQYIKGKVGINGPTPIGLVYKKVPRT
jgi:hypothetical protein